MSKYFPVSIRQVKQIARALSPETKFVKPIILPTTGRPVSLVPLSNRQMNIVDSNHRAYVRLSRKQMDHVIRCYKKQKGCIND